MAKPLSVGGRVDIGVPLAVETLDVGRYPGG